MTFYMLQRTIGKLPADVESKIRERTAAVSEALGVARDKHGVFTGPYIQVVITDAAAPLENRLGKGRETLVLPLLRQIEETDTRENQLFVGVIEEATIIGKEYGIADSAQI